MKRQIIFGPNSRTLGDALITRDRADEFDRVVGEMIGKNYSIQQVIEAMNERGDMTDNEWTSFMYSLGYYVACQEQRDRERAIASALSFVPDDVLESGEDWVVGFDRGVDE